MSDVSVPPWLLVLALLSLVNGCSAPRDPAAAWLQGLVEQAPMTPVAGWTPATPDDSAPTMQLAWHALWVAADAPQDLPGMIAAANRVVLRIDPVWGGVLEHMPADFAKDEALLDATPSAPPVEPALAKTLGSQALALELFAAVYQATGEQRFATAFVLVDEYLQDWLRRRDGRYAKGQLARPQGLRSGLSVADYWSTRREHDRRGLGVPGVHGSAETTTQLHLARAYLAATNVFAEPNYLAAADQLLAATAADAESACGAAALRLNLQLQRSQRQQDLESLSGFQQQLQDLLIARLDAQHCPASDNAELNDLGRVALALALRRLMQASTDDSLDTLQAAPDLLARQALHNVRSATPALQLPVLVAAQQLTPGAALAVHPEINPE